MNQIFYFRPKKIAKLQTQSFLNIKIQSEDCSKNKNRCMDW